jgi:hypothetical protein
MIQTRLSEPEDKVLAQERATLTRLQEELYSVEVGTLDSYENTRMGWLI